jgi:hypothetical protein
MLRIVRVRIRTICRVLGELVVPGLAALTLCGCAALPAVQTIGTAADLGSRSGDTPSIRLWGHDGPEAAVGLEPDALSFGTTALYAESVRTLTLSNPSRFPLTIVSVTVNSPLFAVVNQPSRLVIPANGQLTLALRFRPEVTGYYYGVLALEVDNPGPSFRHVHVEGRGVDR